LKLLLDTMYFLPIIGISVKNLPKDTPTKLMHKKHQIFISDITISELSAKGAKYAASGLIPPERISRGIRALIYNETIKILRARRAIVLVSRQSFSNPFSASFL